MMNKLFQLYDSIVVLDCETSGLDFENDEIIELAAIRVVQEDGEIVIAEDFDVLVKLSDGRTIPPEIVELTHITQGMLDTEGISAYEAASKLDAMCSHGSTLVVAYNAQFDMQFLFYMLLRNGKTNCLTSIRMMDALTVYKDRRPYPHKLRNAIEAYALDEENTHRAIDDTKATLSLLIAMSEEKDDLLDYVGIFGYNPKYGVSGKKISSVMYVPQGYHETCTVYEKYLQSMQKEKF